MFQSVGGGSQSANSKCHQGFRQNIEEVGVENEHAKASPLSRARPVAASLPSEAITCSLCDLT